MSISPKAMLIILDGWGIGTQPHADAIAQANTPFADNLMANFPNSRLITFGEDVGLPEGQMGNSEVGHLNIGAGRVVYQSLARINKAISSGQMERNEKLQAAFRAACREESAVHLMGLVSDGGVHSHIDHLKAMIDIAEKLGPERLFVHAFTDGRDVDPESGAGFIQELEDYVANKNTEIATVIGRYFAMDRDERWERIKKAYDLLVHGKGEASNDLVQAIRRHYSGGTTDEFLPPLVKLGGNGEPMACLKPGDLLICFNFRTDRPRQISRALTQQDFPAYDMHALDIRYLTMSRYDDTFEKIEVLFENEDIPNTLGETLAKAGKTQLRIAETEKYPHVTYFFSGGRETAFNGECRILIPSPKVATYDLQPEMSALEMTSAVIDHIESNQPDFICLNYANTDMVGHTGVFEAAMKAAETVDGCLKKLVETALSYDYSLVIIADHGNSDFMINEDGSPNTAHTKNLVPCIFVSRDKVQKYLVKDGRLADIAPTLLGIMGLEVPDEMNGVNLLIAK